MSLRHEFFLVPTAVGYRELMGCSKKRTVIVDAVDVPDNLIRYISDSLDWIPSKNPAKSVAKEEKGLNYYGVTLFDQFSADSMERIMNSWHSLFMNSPEKLMLTGDFEFSSTKNIQGDYERLLFNRNEVLESLMKLGSMAAELKEGGLHLYHFGI